MTFLPYGLDGNDACVVIDSNISTGTEKMCILSESDLSLRGRLKKAFTEVEQDQR